MLIPRLRNLLMLKNSVIPALSQPIANTHFASIHSTPSTCVKRKGKGNDDGRRFQQSSKDSRKHVTRQRRADAKRALNDLLYYSGSSKSSFRTFIQHEDPIRSFDAEPSAGSKKKKQKAFAQRAKKYHQDRIRGKQRRESFFEDFADRDDSFRATSANKWYNYWSFINKTFQSNSFRFEWQEPPNWNNKRYKGWEATSESETDNESYSIGSRSDRIMLGLPPTGPLKMDDVKNAFRSSALKWHPDKHQGTTQAAAAEKFKLCVNAYKSICDALS